VNVEVASLQRRRQATRLFVLSAALLFVLAVPLIIQGAPLADDFPNCLLPGRRGLLGFLGESAARLGVVRPARFLEILVTTGVCQTLPFGVAIAVPLALTFGVAIGARSLLAEVGAPPEWAAVGAALWLLQPLGSEAALWPAALHVPLGLLLALIALLASRHEHLIRAGVAAFGAYLCAEQTILAVPVAVWFLSRRARRAAATFAVAAPSLLVGVAYLLAQGNDPRLAVSVSQRLIGMFVDPAFYVLFPAVGIGIQSIPLAVLWAFPLSLAVLGAGGLIAARWGTLLLRGPCAEPIRSWPMVIGAWFIVVAAANLPVLINVPHQGSPRTFTPTWLLLCAGLALAAPRVRWTQPTLAATVAGVYLAGAALSLCLSVSVRYRTAELVEAVAYELAQKVHTGDDVILCGVPRTAVTPAPRGAFAVHDFLFDWSAAGAMDYYTGVRPVFRIVDEQAACPSDGAAHTFVFADLISP
jgi:hypothetical protein